jgi:hypothetical protein
VVIQLRSCGADRSRVRRWKERDAGDPTQKPQSQVANLHAFARLYGVVRWFHPSDAAAGVDWNQFAVNGVRRVMGLRDGQQLRSTLSELFAANERGDCAAS